MALYHNFSFVDEYGPQPMDIDEDDKTDYIQTATSQQVPEPSKPYRKKTIPKTLREKVWNTYIGSTKGEGKCLVCSSVITAMRFECGHVISEFEGGELSVENLRPICSTCNRSMRTKNMEVFMREIGIAKPANWYGIDKMRKSPVIVIS